MVVTACSSVHHSASPTGEPARKEPAHTSASLDGLTATIARCDTDPVAAPDPQDEHLVREACLLLSKMLPRSSALGNLFERYVTLKRNISKQ
jgi:hypothetical protein